MSKFDWCLRAQHKDCLEKYQRFYIGPVGRGRQRRDGVILLDEWRECECSCHSDSPVEEKPAKKTRRKK